MRAPIASPGRGRGRPGTGTRREQQRDASAPERSGPTDRSFSECIDHTHPCRCVTIECWNPGKGIHAGAAVTLPCATLGRSFGRLRPGMGSRPIRVPQRSGRSPTNRTFAAASVRIGPELLFGEELVNRDSRCRVRHGAGRRSRMRRRQFGCRPVVEVSGIECITFGQEVHPAVGDTEEQRALSGTNENDRTRLGELSPSDDVEAAAAEPAGQARSGGSVGNPQDRADDEQRRNHADHQIRGSCFHVQLSIHLSGSACRRSLRSLERRIPRR